MEDQAASITDLQDQQQAMLKRLARVEGQIRGIQAMIKRGEECEAIAQQFSAARSALDKSYRLMLTCLLEEALLDQNQDTGAALDRVRGIFTKYT
ncbi:metal-sensing transcriptional repressor [Stutzerimonas stutzeri]|uniref:metal-sensing transcriptional repressor n=1 Tax=Stutzerimonas sp. S1 TaxID=3030652 RepID=UPI002224A9E4|nr:metal-sensing transcriptional repressor [Stutzerimonas sp. S1]MCW3150358.1 metal-sensing transcriptional repressor [Stutzerimonas sp. S1]